MGLFRLLIWGGLIYFGYRIIKNLILPNTSLDAGAAHQHDEIADVMVKDPVCEVYFPKRDGVYVRIDDEDFYFCSKACRNKFLALRSKQ